MARPMQALMTVDGEFAGEVAALPTCFDMRFTLSRLRSRLSRGPDERAQANVDRIGHHRDLVLADAVSAGGVAPPRDRSSHARHPLAGMGGREAALLREGEQCLGLVGRCIGPMIEVERARCGSGFGLTSNTGLRVQEPWPTRKPWLRR